MSIALAWALARPRRGSGILTGIQITASAIACVFTCATAILAIRFWTILEATGGYRILALALVGLLFVPLTTLGASAARLAVRSRDDRLATLRLLGMRSQRVRLIAVIETTLIQAVGIAIGFALSLALPWPMSHLPIRGSTLEPDALHLPPTVAAGVLVGLVLIAALSAQLGLRRVILTPLGVRQRADAPRLTVMRLILAGLTVIAGTALLRLASPSWGAIGLVLAVTLAVVIVMSVLAIAGPYAVTLTARRRLRSATDPATLIAVRRNLDDPRGTWRLVSSIALTSFVLVPTGSMLGFLDAVRRGPTSLTADQITLLTDARTMLLAVVAVSFIVVACQIALTQTAALLEHKDLYIALDRIGMPTRTMTQARRAQIIGPALIAVVGSATAAAILTFPLLAVAAAASTVYIAVTLTLLGSGLLIVLLGVEATSPLLVRTLSKPQRGE